MKVGFRPKRKSLFKVVYIQNGIITGGFYEPVASLLFRPVKEVAPCTQGVIYRWRGWVLIQPLWSEILFGLAWKSGSG